MMAGDVTPATLVASRRAEMSREAGHRDAPRDEASRDGALRQP